MVELMVGAKVDLKETMLVKMLVGLWVGLKADCLDYLWASLLAELKVPQMVEQMAGSKEKKSVEQTATMKVLMKAAAKGLSKVDN